MFIIIVIAVLLGVWRYRSRQYFKWIGITFLWMLVATFLFSGGGTLDNPSGDGLVAHQVRVATNDGAGMGIFAIVVVVVLWSGIIFLLSRAAKAARAVREADELALQSADYVEPADASRKALETVAVLLVAAGWFYFNFTLARSARATPAPSQQTPQTPQQPTIEQEVMGLAAEVNASVPQRIDPDTMLVRASASGRTLTYHYQLEPRGVTKGDAQGFLIRNVTPRACTGVLRPYMRDDNVTFAYRYTSDDFSGPVVVTVSEQVCSNLEP